MITTNFSLSRLLQLIRKQWVENSRLYFFSALALLGMLGLIMFFWFLSDGKHYSEDSLFVIFVFTLYVSGAVFASLSFSMLGNKERGTYWLAFPASHLEKLLCMIFYNVVFFTAVFCLCFFLVKSVAVNYVSSLVAQYPGEYSFRRSSWDKDNSFLGILPWFIYGFFAIQSFYMMGSVYFPRYSFIITTVVGSALIFVFVYFSAELIGNTLESYSWNGDHLRKYDEGLASYKRYELSPAAANMLSVGLKYIWAPVFWTIAWFKLKEKQI
jgi:hypothetical protein